jgi:predicted ArsR family transcriptional regulator
MEKALVPTQSRRCVKQNNEDTIRLLADATRLKIFRAILSNRGEGMTAADAAARFGVHANVARMHLEKLAGAGLVRSGYRKSAGGGRPARFYSAGGGMVAIQYPPRDYMLLADITLDSLSSGKKPESIAWSYGFELGESALTEAALDRDDAKREELVGLFERIAGEQGLFAEVSSRGEGHLRLLIYNCCFRELSTRHGGLVCSIHRSMFLGLSEAIFGKARVTSSSGIATGGDSCRFEIKY